MLFNAVVARPVGKAEIAAEPEAREAMDKEWDRLREKKVWDESEIEDWDVHAAKARKAGKDVNYGYLFRLVVEKGSELPKGHANRKYKYRVVFQGSRVVSQDWEVATFEDLGSSPATLEAARAGDADGAAPGRQPLHQVKMKEETLH